MAVSATTKGAKRARERPKIQKAMPGKDGSSTARGGSATSRGDKSARAKPAAAATGKTPPGSKDAKVRFPLHSKHLVARLILDHYEDLAEHKIINSDYYDSRRNMLLLPKSLATIVLDKD